MNIAVVSLILPDNEMPCTEDGRPAEIVCNSLGVLGRMNVAQNYEHELNYIASEIRRTSKTSKSFYSKIMKFYSLACPEFFDYLNSMCNEELKPYIDEMYDTGDIYIHQQPFHGNISMENMANLYKVFNIEKTKIKDVQNPLIFAKLYFVKLKHEASKKFSVRSTGMTNLLDTPHKTNEKQKRGNAPFNTNPVRIGEQEFLNMQLLGQPKTLHEFLKHYASESSERENMLVDILSKDVSEIDEFPKNKNSLTNSAQTVRSIFRSIGIKLHDSEEN